jgi:hypothetical protein
MGNDLLPDGHPPVAHHVNRHYAAVAQVEVAHAHHMGADIAMTDQHRRTGRVKRRAIKET